ncbi:hypothetical protein N0V82_002304 [Gnomoniopsis sp. IMI 355080]|nr:hypothetical protein N0V82_002304 [Gnomoniopsis sp. IMI 355080]
MSRDEIVSEPIKDSGVKVPLRTYSRHGRITKRNSTILPEQLLHPRDITNSDNHGDMHRGAQPGCHQRRQRRRTTPRGKTPTEIFWELLSSSAPALTHPLETDELESSVPIEAEEDAAPVDKHPHGDRTGDELQAKDGTQEPRVTLGLRAHDATHELRALRSTSQDDRSLGKPDKFETTPKTTRARRSLDVDESLSMLEVTSASASIVYKNSTVRCKDSNTQGFRKLEISNGTIVTHSSDGFERDEARPDVVGKRRRIDSIDRSIGSLELMQKSVAFQKIEGPTWLRGQKKPRVATTTPPWSRRQYFSTSMLQIDSEEDDDLLQVKQSKPADQGTGNRLKRRTSLDVSDHDEEPMALSVADVLMDNYNTHSKAGVEIIRKSHAKHVNDFLYISDDDEPVVFDPPAGNEEELSVATTYRTNAPEHGGDVEGEAPYISDGDESVVLLVYPEDNEDVAALATIPRTDTPETVADIDKAESQLPPKQWVLNVLDSKENTLTLRPDSSEWRREVEIPDTSPWK